jgi:Mannose-6-phosphate isomerase
MCNNHVAELFADGKVFFPGKELNAAKLSWYEHPAYKGVFMKDLVLGADTEGAFSCHVILVKKGFEVGMHDHKAEWELNEVIEGTGYMVIDGKKVACRPGLSYVTPPGIEHDVSAPNEDMIMTAKFVPALR